MRLNKWLWVALAMTTVALAFAGVVDRAGEAAAEDAFKRALVTFAAARALNSAISVAQGTELAVEPGGVGVIVAIGEALDPINDLVEQFSTVMLVATSSLGLQNILLDITAWWGITALLCLAAGAVLLTSFIPQAAVQAWLPLARRLLLAAIFLRFVLPLLVIGTSWAFDTFLAAEQAAATAAIESTTATVQAINDDTATDTPDPEDMSLLDRLDSAINDALETFQIDERLERVDAALSNAAEHVINLIVIFLLQTIVFPILFAWLLLEGLKALGNKALGQ
jgi:hypothetical protein